MSSSSLSGKTVYLLPLVDRFLVERIKAAMICMIASSSTVAKSRGRVRGRGLDNFVMDKLYGVLVAQEIGRAHV